MQFGLRQCLGNIAGMQRQCDPVFGPDDPLDAARTLRPGVNQLVAEGPQFRPRGQGAAGILGIQGKTFEADEMKPLMRVSCLLPELPRRKEVEPGTKPKLGNGEIRSCEPSFGQAAPLKKDRSGFFQAVVA